MSEFVFLYYDCEAGRSPELREPMVHKWRTWFKELSDKGHLKDWGRPLESSGKLVRGRHKTVTDGPFSETKEVVGGYTLIAARDLEQAVQLAGGCPIFEVGGSVEVRAVWDVEA